ncbi:hypothetical protein [Profundibacterium mesophilum]|uniref:Uncharacterized protein n=1 Tax=Profundibacterium mesophilum KAUST100406-0324 TaxID=1037889 RepID=A0A921NRI7_9RHOB|nr:hypothetical protein [Profundibacterium mesophilum]KAF0677332.1 hypothetical protein PMES_00379 [Profundibacterium mesophilum KAUST100406-0324]
MSQTSLVLFIDLKPDAKVDLRSAARAAIAWADTIERVGEYVDPFASPQVDLVSSEPGSQRIKALIRSISSDPKSDVRTAVIVAALFIAKVSVAWGWEQLLEFIKGPDAPESVQQLSEEEMVELAKQVAQAIRNEVGVKPARRVFQELNNDERVVGVGVTGRDGARPVHIVTKPDFPTQFTEEDGTESEQRVKVEEVELILLRAVLTTETTKRWGFRGPFGNFGASIKDQAFLDRLASGALNVPMREGIILKVLLETTEERKDDVWKPKEHVVQRVLHVSPPPYQPSVLPGP